MSGRNFGTWSRPLGFMLSLQLVDKWRPALAIKVFVGRWSISVALVAQVRLFGTDGGGDWPDKAEYAHWRIGIGPIDIEIERDWK